MWLLSQNKILTRTVLIKKDGLVPHFVCSTKLIMIKLPFIYSSHVHTFQKFGFGCACAFQDIHRSWQSFEDLVTQAVSLPHSQQQACLVTISDICWSVWKERNGMCFHNFTLKTVRQIVILIEFLLDYWIGNMKAAVATHIKTWRPEDLN